MTIGERIKARRIELGMSADQLAEKIGVSRSTIFRYENGAIGKVPSEVLAQIAIALRTSFTYLIGMEGDVAPTVGDTSDDEINEILNNLDIAKKHEALRYLRYLSDN